jgi:hypothetical protein
MPPFPARAFRCGATALPYLTAVMAPNCALVRVAEQRRFLIRLTTQSVASLPIAPMPDISGLAPPGLVLGGKATRET